jgi:transposase
MFSYHSTVQRGDVIEAVMGEHRPQIWVSDLFSAQKTHPAESWQVCLAHQLHDCQYGIDAGDEIFSQRMKTILLRSFVLQKRWSGLSQDLEGYFEIDAK